MEVTASARKHCIADADILHAWEHALRLVPQEYGDEARMLVFGPARDGTILELVVVEANSPSRIIHADRIRPKFFPYLR